MGVNHANHAKRFNSAPIQVWKYLNNAINKGCCDKIPEYCSSANCRQLYGSIFVFRWHAKACSEPRQTYKDEANGSQLLTSFPKSSVLDVWLGSEYASKGLGMETFVFWNSIKLWDSISL